ncbi:unnamed protein product [Callosobruchus maculatus]|uniref:Uncharacterized protein n=1 Tax=Callosobruchus maculatus TaxID=64391 RepID=A0A653BWS9_CALMS|nr:unnamed protein product [Callosobruchus maculatus]
MTRLEEQKQAVSQALQDQDQRISAIETQIVTVATSQKNVEEQLQQVKDQVKEMIREELREFSAGELSLTAAASDLPDRHSGVVAKPYPYNEKTS